MAIFRGYGTFFFRITGLQLQLSILIKSSNLLHWKAAKKNKVDVVLGQNLGQIMSNIVKKVEKQALSTVFFFFFSYFTLGYLLKKKEVVVQTPEWKSEANIARNTTFEGH